jgi:hypothetical protein
MDPLAGDNHSFIVKIRVEDRSLAEYWHGQVTHVPSGRRRSFRTLGAMNAFIAPYLPEPPATERAWPGWLRRWIGGARHEH